MQAQTILSTPETEAAQLLGTDPGSIRNTFRKLASEWHPDLRTGDPIASKVMAHLNLLREIAEGRRPPNGRPADRVRFDQADGRSTMFEALSSHAFDTGTVRVGRNSIAYAFDAGSDDLLQNETITLGTLPFPDAAIRTEIERFLPRSRKVVPLVSGSIAVQARAEGDILLADLIDRCPDKLTAKHVAWIVSGIMNIASFLHVARIEHGAIAPQTLLVSPKQHSVSLIGGWGFAVPFGTRRTAAPSRSVSARPEITRADSLADGVLDVELARRTAMDMVGAPSPAQLLVSGALPSGMTSWITAPSGRDAVEEYRDWHDKVVRDFGPRRFTDLDVGEADVYGRHRAA